MNETLKTLETRRSCRKFLDKMPLEDEINAVIRAGTFAPSGMGRQPAKIIAVTDKSVRDKISAENARIMGQQKGFDPFIPQEIKEAERKERLALAAKAAMDAVKASAHTQDFADALHFAQEKRRG